MAEVLNLTLPEQKTLGQNWGWIKFIISSGADLSALLADVGTITNSTATWENRVAALHHAIDILAAVIKAMPKADPVAMKALKAKFTHHDSAEKELVALVGGRFDGTFIKNLLAMWPQIFDIIKTLLPLFGFVI